MGKIVPLFGYALLPLLLLPLAGICFAQDKCTKPSEFQPALCQIKLPRITEITIDENAARSAAEDTQTNCTRFKLTNSTVRRYFNKAWQIKNESEAHHKLTWLPCYASGTMRFADGKTAHWGIRESQNGSLVFDGCKSEIVLYCPTCKFKPFLW